MAGSPREVVDPEREPVKVGEDSWLTSIFDEADRRVAAAERAGL